MAQFSLSSHRFTITEKGRVKKGEVKDLEILDNIGEKKRATPAILYDIFKSNLQKSGKTVEKIQKTYKFESITYDDSKRMICGNMKTGEYGFEAELHDVKTDKKRIKSENEAELIPYYFLIYIPNESTEGYVILERFQKLGVQTIFFQALNDIIDSELNSDEVQYKLNTGNCFSLNLFLEILENSTIKELKAITTVNAPKSPDIADQLVKDNAKTQKITETDYIMKTVIQPQKSTGKIQKIQKTLIAMLKKQEPIGTGLLSELNIDKYDELSLVVNDNKMSRTIRLYEDGVKLDYNNQLFPYIDITDSVKKTKGLPEFTSIDTYARNHLNSLLEKKQPLVFSEDIISEENV